VACTALAAAVGEVKGGQTRLRQAEEVLAGPEGLGRWRELHQQLVMRRCHLVSRLAVAYQVGPVAATAGLVVLADVQLDGHERAPGACVAECHAAHHHMVHALLLSSWSSA
jgi:hypothetical protein